MPQAIEHRISVVRIRGQWLGKPAYGVVGRFQKAPVEPGQFVLMDFRCDHLSEEQRQQPPTFLYAMDFGDGVLFPGGNIASPRTGGAGS
jgi:lycopene beta-cyclase